MAITRKQLQVAIQNAKFPIGKRPIAEEIVWNGLELFREFKTPRYFSHTGKLVKKSQSAHKTLMGRYNQRKARTILISALCRAWLEAFKKKPQLNNKADSMTAFHHFAQEVMAHEGIGKIQEHLEEFWSTRKTDWEANEKKATFRGE